MKPLTTYAQWCECLKALETCPRDDLDLLEKMKAGSISWTSGVAECFGKRVYQTLNARLQKAQGEFNRKENGMVLGSAAHVAHLLTLRKEFDFLFEVIQSLPIPQAERHQLEKDMTEHANQTQSNLEASAKRDRTGYSLSVVKNHAVNLRTTRTDTDAREEPLENRNSRLRAVRRNGSMEQASADKPGAQTEAWKREKPVAPVASSRRMIRRSYAHQQLEDEATER